jgi:hypothetical protein
MSVVGEDNRLEEPVYSFPDTFSSEVLICVTPDSHLLICDGYGKFTQVNLITLSRIELDSDTLKHVGHAWSVFATEKYIIRVVICPRNHGGPDLCRGS